MAINSSREPACHGVFRSMSANCEHKTVSAATVTLAVTNWADASFEVPIQPGSRLKGQRRICVPQKGRSLCASFGSLSLVLSEGQSKKDALGLEPATER